MFEALDLIGERISVYTVFGIYYYCVFIYIAHGGAFITSSGEEKDMQSYILTVALQASFQKVIVAVYHDVHDCFQAHKNSLSILKLVAISCNGCLLFMY